VPKDKAGKFHLNTQRAHASDRAAGSKNSPKETPEKDPIAPHNEGEGTGIDGEQAHSITPHGDGTFHSDGPGGHMEHQSLGDAITHAGHSLSGGGKHMHHHHDGVSIKSHSMNEAGEHQEMEHGSGEEAGQHVADFMNEAGGEQQPSEGQQEMAPAGGGGGSLTGF